MIDLDKLRDYLTADPDNLALTALWPLYDDTAIAAVLNDKTKGKPVAVVSRPQAEVAKAILADPALIAKFTPLLPFIQLAEDVPASVFAQHIPHLAERPGSPMENLFGAGVRVEPGEVSAAVPLAVQTERDKLAADALAKEQADLEVSLFAHIKERIAKNVTTPDRIHAHIERIKAAGHHLDDAKIAEVATAERKRMWGGD